jgi:hypothetical protein
MDLKHAMGSEENRSRYHIIARLRKAVKTAISLKEIAHSLEQCDARTRLEATVGRGLGSSLCGVSLLSLWHFVGL